MREDKLAVGDAVFEEEKRFDQRNLISRRSWGEDARFAATDDGAVDVSAASGTNVLIMGDTGNRQGADSRRVIFEAQRRNETFVKIMRGDPFRLGFGNRNCWP